MICGDPYRDSKVLIEPNRLYDASIKGRLPPTSLIVNSNPPLHRSILYTDFHYSIYSFASGLCFKITFNKKHFKAVMECLDTRPITRRQIFSFPASREKKIRIQN